MLTIEAIDGCLMTWNLSSPLILEVTNYKKDTKFEVLVLDAINPIKYIE
jgi:hypothetical protein